MWQDPKIVVGAERRRGLHRNGTAIKCAKIAFLPNVQSVQKPNLAQREPDL